MVQPCAGVAQPCSWGFSLKVPLPCAVPRFPSAGRQRHAVRGCEGQRALGVSAQQRLLVLGWGDRGTRLCMGDVSAAHVL